MMSNVDKIGSYGHKRSLEANSKVGSPCQGLSVRGRRFMEKKLFRLARDAAKYVALFRAYLMSLFSNGIRIYPYYRTDVRDFQFERLCRDYNDPARNFTSGSFFSKK